MHTGWNHRRALVCAALWTAVPAAYGQQDDATLVLGSVEVTARRTGPLTARNVLSSVDVLGPDQLQGQQVQHAWELFARAPGVLLTQFRQGNESGKLSFRGFNGEGEVNAVKLLIDGIPANDNAGGMPYLDMLFPLEIEHIEIVRGTNDPRYGLHNIAGNANIATRSGGNDGAVRVGYGSFATREVQYAQGIEHGNWSQNYFVGHAQSHGYRDHAAFEKTTVSGKWAYTSDDGRTRTGVNARHTEGDGDEAGYLEAGDARAHPTGSYAWAQSTGGNRAMTQASAHLDHMVDDALSFSGRLYVNTVRDQRWLRYALAASQQERVIDERHTGLLASLTYRPGAAVAFEAGVNAEHQHNRSPRYNTVDQVRVATTRDQRFTFDNYGAYVQAVLQPLAGLKLIPGYRVDRVAGDFADPSKNVRYAIQPYGLIRQTKLSAVYAASASTSLYANWGRTFQLGAGAASYQATSGTLQPSINAGWEGGVKFAPADWLQGRVAVWRQDASGEVKRRLNDPEGGSDNLGRTRRQGVDGQLNARVGASGSAWASYSLQRSRIVAPDPAAPATLGKQIDHMPRTLYSAGYDWQASPALKLTAWVGGQGGYFLTTANTGGQYGAYTLVNLGAAYRVSPTVTFDVQVKNLANRYVEYVWLNDRTRHAPGDGRAVYLSANITI
ncbi:MAG: TonB-dependent receptor [Duganella sp.]